MTESDAVATLAFIVSIWIGWPLFQIASALRRIAKKIDEVR